MLTLVVANQKGGVGKTTIAGHLGVMAESCQAGPVALIDTDPQGSLSSWWNERKVETPLFASVDIDHLHSHLKKLSGIGVKIVIIDTPPAVTDTIRKVISVANLVLIPTRPSPHDLRAVGSTVDIVKSLKKKVIFVINGAANRAKITSEAAIALSQYGAVATVILYQRTDFAASMIDGRTTQEVDVNGRAAAEIHQLWQYVSAQIKK